MSAAELLDLLYLDVDLDVTTGGGIGFESGERREAQDTNRLTGQYRQARSPQDQQFRVRVRVRVGLSIVSIDGTNSSDTDGVLSLSSTKTELHV